MLVQVNVASANDISPNDCSNIFFLYLICLLLLAGKRTFLKWVHPHLDYPQLDYPQLDYPHLDLPQLDYPQLDYPHLD